MTTEFDINSLNTFDKRKAMDYLGLKEMCARSSKISFKVVDRNKRKLPIEYLIRYDDVKSIIGINPDQSPIYGFKHKLKIKLEHKYPETPAICYFKSTIWHPNIKFEGNNAGHVCYNEKDLAAGYTIAELVEFIGRMIQYKNYHAILGQDPYPEDVEAAKWVNNYAEPKGLVNYREKIAIDNSYLLDPLPGYEIREKPEIDFFD